MVGSDGGLLHNVVARMPATPLPAAISPPSISGVAQQGQTLAETHGAWTNSPSTYAYQWDRCATNVGFTVIPCSTIHGATSQTYTLAAADVGSGIRVRETAITSASGIGAPAPSAFTAVVQASPPGSPPVPPSTSVPVSTSPPSITGRALEEQVLAETHGAWSDGPIIGYAQQWERCDAAGNNCIAIAGATARTYLLVAADAGHTVRVAETATNAYGTGGPAPSPPTGVVGALPKLGFLSIHPRAFRAARKGPPVTRSQTFGAAV
jgi:hypothetical protein